LAGVRLGKKGGCEQEEKPLSVCQFGLNGGEKEDNVGFRLVNFLVTTLKLSILCTENYNDGR
jgi:hypothetical protein